MPHSVRAVVARAKGEPVTVEIIEVPDHPWFVASQFHPEFKSRPDAPSPLHLGLVRAALER